MRMLPRRGKLKVRRLRRHGTELEGARDAVLGRRTGCNPLQPLCHRRHRESPGSLVPYPLRRLGYAPHASTAPRGRPDQPVSEVGHPFRNSLLGEVLPSATIPYADGVICPKPPPCSLRTGGTQGTRQWRHAHAHPCHHCRTPRPSAGRSRWRHRPYGFLHAFPARRSVPGRSTATGPTRISPTCSTPGDAPDPSQPRSRR